MQSLRQTALTEPSVGILVSSAESDDDVADNTVLQASPGAELTINDDSELTMSDESELTGKRRLQQFSTLSDRNRIVQIDDCRRKQNDEAKFALHKIRNFPD